jgi:hypothetical protein
LYTVPRYLFTIKLIVMKSLLPININNILSNCFWIDKFQHSFEKAVSKSNFKINLLINFSIKKLVVYKLYRRLTLKVGVKNLKLIDYRVLLCRVEVLINKYRLEVKNRFFLWRRRLLHIVEGRVLKILNLISFKLKTAFLLNYSVINYSTTVSNIDKLIANFLNKK